MTDLTIEPTYIRATSLRRDLTWVLAFVVVLVAGLGSLLWIGVTHLGTALADGLSTAVYESGAAYATEAVNVAHTERVSPGNVTLEELQRQQPSARWLAGNVAVTGSLSGTNNEVSVAASGDHVTTATFPLDGGICSYGLVVTSDNDPVVAADGLPGTGAFATSEFSGPCAADLAPTSGWTRVSAAALRSVATAPTGG